MARSVLATPPRAANLSFQLAAALAGPEAIRIYRTLDFLAPSIIILSRLKRSASLFSPEQPVRPAWLSTSYFVDETGVWSVQMFNALEAER